MRAKITAAANKRAAEATQYFDSRKQMENQEAAHPRPAMKSISKNLKRCGINPADVESMVYVYFKDLPEWLDYPKGVLTNAFGRPTLDDNVYYKIALKGISAPLYARAGRPIITAFNLYHYNSYHLWYNSNVDGPVFVRHLADLDKLVSENPNTQIFRGTGVSSKGA